MSSWSDLMAWFRRVMHRGDSLYEGEGQSAGAGADTTSPGRLVRLSKRDRQLAGLQAGYMEMLDLMRGLREHLERQQEVQDKMVHVLERLPDSMDGLKNVGKAAEQQVEVLSLLRQQIEAGTEHDQQLVESMKQFNQTLSVMDETSRHSGRAVNQLIEKAAVSEQRLRDTIDRSERRFLFVLILFAVIAALAVGAVVWIGLRTRGESLPGREERPARRAVLEAPAAVRPAMEEPRLEALPGPDEAAGKEPPPGVLPEPMSASDQPTPDSPPPSEPSAEVPLDESTTADVPPEAAPAAPVLTEPAAETAPSESKPVESGLALEPAREETAPDLKPAPERKKRSSGKRRPRTDAP